MGPDDETARRIAALVRIGWRVDDAVAVAESADPIAARDALVDRLRPAYKARVRELHPDLNGIMGDTEAAELRDLLYAWADLESWEPPGAPPKLEVSREADGSMRFSFSPGPPRRR